MSVADVLTTLSAQNPLVHCMTHYVAMNIAVNVVLAAQELSGRHPTIIRCNASERRASADKVGPKGTERAFYCAQPGDLR